MVKKRAESALHPPHVMIATTDTINIIHSINMITIKINIQKYFSSHFMWHLENKRKHPDKIRSTSSTASTWSPSRSRKMAKRRRFKRQRKHTLSWIFKARNIMTGQPFKGFKHRVWGAWIKTVSTFANMGFRYTILLESKNWPLLMIGVDYIWDNRGSWHFALHALNEYCIIIDQLSGTKVLESHLTKLVCLALSFGFRKSPWGIRHHTFV